MVPVSGKRDSPIGVVSKNETGERNTCMRAALNIVRLALKLAYLVQKVRTACHQGYVESTHAKAKLSTKEKMA